MCSTSPYGVPTPKVSTHPAAAAASTMVAVTAASTVTAPSVPAPDGVDERHPDGDRHQDQQAERPDEAHGDEQVPVRVPAQAGGDGDDEPR